MAIAEEFQIIGPRIAFWQAYAPAVKCDLTCCALRNEQGLVFVDPIPLAKSALDELLATAEPVAIVLTNGNHARAAAQFRDRFSIPIVAHAEAVVELGLEVDRPIEEPGEILAGIEAVTVEGAGPGEIALHFAAADLMVVGDALIHVPPQGFALLPDKYCLAPRSMRTALQKLLRFEFEVMTFAHGSPLVSQSRQKLESLLA